VSPGARLNRSLALLAAVVPVLASLTVVGAAARVGPPVATCAQAATLHHAALVVEHGDGVVIRRCVAFSGDSITGDQLLAASHVQYATAAYGGTGKAVCQIDYEPTSYPPGCWTTSSPYWAMFVSRGGGGWRISSLGISSQTFRDGDAEGFRYEGQSDYSVPPGPAGVCPLPATPTAVPARTPEPAPNRSGGPGATRAATPSSTARALSGVAASSVAPSPSVNPTPRAGATGTPSVAAATNPGRRPPAQPTSFSASALAASALGAALLLLLAVQTRRLRRGPSPPGWQR
jgi:hypothetical protein